MAKNIIFAENNLSTKLKFMKNIFFFILLLFSMILAQESIRDLQNLSNKQLDILKSELKNDSVKLKNDSADPADPAIPKVKINSGTLKTTNNFFGYEYFDKTISFFDNIPTPEDFRLGPGDEITLSLWGETNSRESFVINKEGFIYYKNIGFINLSNLSLSEAEKVLIEQLSKIYSTLEDGSSNLSIELGQIKSINIFFSGHVNNPGVNLIHPFSDVYSAIIQSGGIQDSGSLRNIKIIRSGKIINTIDFYSFFMTGKNNFSNIKLVDGDVIHIPAVQNRVEISGEINRPKFYELLDSDTLTALIEYSGGLKATASDKIIIREIFPIDERFTNDEAKTGYISTIAKSSKKIFNNGTQITILPIGDNETDVTVYGRVSFPGKYPINNQMIDFNNQPVIKKSSLRDVLDLAGGFDDPVFRKTIVDEIVVLRLDENQYYGKEFKINYDDAANFELQIDDRIFVYQNTNYSNVLTYIIKGEVLKPGKYILKDGLTLKDAISLAGGVTEIGSINSVSISRNDQDNENRIGNTNLDFLVGNNNIITILPKENVVGVFGNVYNSGFVAHDGKKLMTMSKAIQLAGGHKPNSLKKSAYIVRANGRIESAKFFRGRTKRVYPGDSVFVPVDPSTDDFDITKFISELSSTLANIAAILVITDNQ